MRRRDKRSPASWSSVRRPTSEDWEAPPDRLRPLSRCKMALLYKKPLLYTMPSPRTEQASTHSSSVYMPTAAGCRVFPASSSLWTSLKTLQSR
jgi:hypothetical protein